MPHPGSGIALASAARTATTTSDTIVNQVGAKGVQLHLYVTASAAGTGGLQVQVMSINPSNPASSLAINALPTAVTATGTTVITLYPGASTSGTQATSGALGRLWAVKVTHGNSDTYAYSVGYSYIA